jgi:hypothetical protein
MSMVNLAPVIPNCALLVHDFFEMRVLADNDFTE